MEVHIGKEIRRVIDKKGITGAWLAGKIGTSKRNLYALLNRSEISTKQLEEISKALDYDFFELYRRKAGSSKEPLVDYEKKPKVLITVELDGGDQTLKEWVKRLTAINQVI